MAHQKKKITISILIPFVVCMLFFSIMIWQKYRASHDLSDTPAPPRAEGRRSVTLFFASEGTHLVREARDVDPCDDDSSCLKSILDELQNGPVGEYMETIPEGAAVETILLEGPLATIEFNSSFSESMLSGSSAEMLAVYSVVNTVNANFPDIHQVKINIDGNSGAVLKHLDLSEPLSPDYSLELPAVPTPEKSVTGSTTTSKGAVP